MTTMTVAEKVAAKVAAEGRRARLSPSTEERREAARRRSEGRAQLGYQTRQTYRLQAGSGGRQPFSPPLSNARSVGFPAELRSKPVKYNGMDLVHLSGVASTTDQPYEMWDFFGPYEEIMDGGAFDKTLAADPDVAFLVNHKGLTMARTIAMPGKKATLVLAKVDTGLGQDAWVNPKRTDVSDLVTAIDDGQVTEMSFAFMLTQGWWSDDFMTFKITEVDLDRGDVSAVNYGANPYTSIEARQQEILADVARMPVGAATAALRELMTRTDVDLDTLYRAAAAARAIVVVTDDEDEGEDDDDVLACPECGAGNEIDAKYCDQCGADMAGAQPLGEPIAGALAASKPARAAVPGKATGRSLLHIEALLEDED